jgi:hypothetical protein
MMTSGDDSVVVLGVLVDPRFLQPFPRIRLIWGDQVKALGLDAWRMAQGLYMARHQEVERFDLIDVRLSFVELFKGPHDGGTGNRYTSHRRLVFKT